MMKKRLPVLLALALALPAGRPAQADPEAAASTAPAPDPPPLFQLFDPGTQEWIDYAKYGMFMNVGTPQYRYIIRDREGLARAAGEGVYPNVIGLLKDPAYQKAQYAGLLEGTVWDFVNTADTQNNFYKWASSQETAGVKQFYVAEMLEKAGLLKQAVKAYYACAVHFPKAIGNTFWKTPWYIGPTSLDRVAFLLRHHPEYGMRLARARIRIRNRFDDDTQNDIFEINPGRIEPATPNELLQKRQDLSSLPVKRELGHGKVRLVQYANDQWQLLIDGHPYILRGMAYMPTPVGNSPDTGTLVVHKDWMLADINKNGKIDGPYESWVDDNKDDRHESDEPVVGDFFLLKQMGVNTLRLYHHGYNKPLLYDLFQHYGIRVIMGDYLGAYAVGSGAEWYKGTDYTDPAQQQKMLDSVKQMVLDYKDEPYIVFWVLGNENNYGNSNNSRQKTDAYYEFVNRAARLIKSLDPNHPVAICNGDVLFLDKAAKHCPDVDIYGSNAYRGSHGFGDSFWQDLADEWGKPAFISEFGCPAYHHLKSLEEAETLQADYLRHNWEDIEYNTGGGQGVGNALGGVIFEWIDEWWKAGPPPQYDPHIHDIVGQFGGPFPDGWSYEEWYGVTSQGNGKNSPFERQLRKAYFVFKNELWNPDKMKERGLPK